MAFIRNGVIVLTLSVLTIVTESLRPVGQISQQKCLEYSEKYNVKFLPPVALIDPERETKNECGHEVVTLIIGGERVTKNEFPHHVALGYGDADKKTWNCGGTLLSDRYILTAAHCLNDQELGDCKYARMGAIKLTEIHDKVQEFNIVERLPHPDYTRKLLYNDIALLKIDKPALINPYVIPACLYQKSDFKVSPKYTILNAIATGFGETRAGDHESQSDELLKVKLHFIDHATCNKTFTRRAMSRLRKGILDETQLCAGPEGLNDDKDTCQGDSGGPLQIYHVGDDIKCMYDVIGIASFGETCGGKAGVYTRVSAYLKWIEDHVWPPK